jgi:hypothetical protein
MKQNQLIPYKVLVIINIMAIYGLWKSSKIVYYQITQQKYRLAIPFAEHNFGHATGVIWPLESVSVWFPMFPEC